MDDQYQANKDDTQKMLHYLRINLPEYATPENAVFLLVQRQIQIETLEQTSPEIVEQMLNDRQA